MGDRYSMSAEQYLAHHSVLTYLQDAIGQLLEHKDDNPKVNAAKFFNDYFTSVLRGSHTLFREYSYIRATPHNRASFIHTCWKCFQQIGKNGDLLNVKEYHSLLCLLCPDFPFEPVLKTARIVLMDDVMDCLISFTDFLFAFQVQFYYQEFVTECWQVYDQLQGAAAAMSARSPRETVVVPSGGSSPWQQRAPHSEPAAAAPAEGVDSQAFAEALEAACQRLAPLHSIPPVCCLSQPQSRVSFYGFLMGLARSEALNQQVGVLPGRALAIAEPVAVTTTPDDPND